MGGVCEDYYPKKRLLEILSSGADSGGPGTRAFYLPAFTTSFNSEMAVNKLSREKQRRKRIQAESDDTSFI